MKTGLEGKSEAELTALSWSAMRVKHMTADNYGVPWASAWSMAAAGLDALVRLERVRRDLAAGVGR